MLVDHTIGHELLAPCRVDCGDDSFFFCIKWPWSHRVYGATLANGEQRYVRLAYRVPGNAHSSIKLRADRISANGHGDKKALAK